jgi:Copper amine oxidase N-terminal domain
MKIREKRPLALAAALALGVTGSALAQGYSRTADNDALPAGTVLKVRLDNRLNSAQARPGERFTATVRPEEDHSVLPEGTRVEGVVRTAQPASKDKPGVLDVDFTTLEFPNGRNYAINGSLSSLDAKSVTRAANGRLVSKRDTKSDKMKFIGYGAGAGALIGLLTKGNLLTNTLLGAAGGYLYGQLNKDKQNGGYHDVDLKEGSEFGVRLDQQFAYLPVSYQSTNRYDRYGQPTAQRDSAYDRGTGVDLRNDRSRTGVDLRNDRSRTGVDLRNDRYRGNNAYGQGTGIGVMVGDREVRFGSARPMRVGTTVMVPMAAVMTATGVPYRYNSASREVTVNGDQGTARLTVGSSVAWANGSRVPLQTPARIINGTLYVPDRFVEVATGMRARWDDSSQTLLFNSRDNSGNPNRDRDRNDRDRGF